MDLGLQVVSAGDTGDDRACAIERQGGWLLIVADGAGGVAGASQSADAAVSTLVQAPLDSPLACVQTLGEIDQRLSGVGETTAVVAVVKHGAVWGASVGDSQAWLVGLDGAFVDLTAEQARKPLLGSGRARAAGFGPVPCYDRLLVGSDGLFKYVAYDQIIEVVTCFPPADAAPRLVRLSRLPSGNLQDDIAVIVAGLAW